MIINNIWNHHLVSVKVKNKPSLKPPHKNSFKRFMIFTCCIYLMPPFQFSIKAPNKSRTWIQKQENKLIKNGQKTRHFPCFYPSHLNRVIQHHQKMEVIDPKKATETAPKNDRTSNFVQLLSECLIDDMEIKETSHPPRNFAKKTTPWRFPYSNYSLLSANLTWW